MSQEPDERDTLTYGEVARLLGIVPKRVYVMVSEGHFHPIRTPGSTSKRIPREEVERYAASRHRSRSEQARITARESADMLLGYLLWGLSDDGPGGVQMRQRILEQARRLRASEAGREALAGIADGLRAVLESEPIKSAESASAERDRLRQLYETITAPAPERQPRRKPAKSPPASLDSNMTASAK